MKEENSEKIQPSKLEPGTGKPNSGGGGGGVSALIIVALIGLSVIGVIVIIYVSTTGGGGGGGGTTTTSFQIPTADSYDMGNNPERIHIQIKKVRIDMRKDNEAFFVRIKLILCFALPRRV